MTISTRDGATSSRILAAALASGILLPASVKADEGGVSFWIPGFFGSLAARPLTPGFSFANIYYHTSVSAGGDVAFARQVTAGNITANFTGNLNANLNADADIYMAIPSYTFAQPFFGGQASVLMIVPYGGNKVGVDATLNGNLGLGGPGFSISGGRTDQIDGMGDLMQQFNVRWNNGVHNYMIYITGNLTVGRYDPARLANLGIGHNALDGGFGYTHLNPQTGNEFSAVLGFTYNFENTNTQYQNGVDMHLDWGASHFFTKQLLAGVVSYAYQQVSCDNGARDRLGCFESRVFGVGPQISYIIPMGQLQGYLNLKGQQCVARGPHSRGFRTRDAGTRRTRLRRATRRWRSRASYGGGAWRSRNSGDFIIGIVGRLRGCAVPGVPRSYR